MKKFKRKEKRCRGIMKKLSRPKEAARCRRQRVGKQDGKSPLVNSHGKKQNTGLKKTDVDGKGIGIS